jgi:hypothetical protein
MIGVRDKLRKPHVTGTIDKREPIYVSHGGAIRRRSSKDKSWRDAEGIVVKRFDEFFPEGRNVNAPTQKEWNDKVREVKMSRRKRKLPGR